MTHYRSGLPQLGERLFLTDGGIETTLIFHDGQDLPDFAAFHLLRSQEGEDALRRYFRSYAELAARFRSGLILESPTWRASTDWGVRLGYSTEMLAYANRRAIQILEEVRDEYGGRVGATVISGCVGPRGDGYVPSAMMSETEAETYHSDQIGTFAGTAADMITAITMNYVEEAVGVTRASRAMNMPVAISFTVETDGRLPTGETLLEAVERVDTATDGYASYFMINCAHPTHFTGALSDRGLWSSRIRGIRANASAKSHAELNEATDLDAGDPDELGRQYADLKRAHPQITVLGGCCGTDARHIESIATACAPYFMQVA